jgi:hypothetical protein
MTKLMVSIEAVKSISSSQHLHEFFILLAYDRSIEIKVKRGQEICEYCAGKQFAG